MNLLFYFKNAIRKNKLLSITFQVRLISAIVGVLSISIILTYVTGELTTDHFFKDSNKIFAHIYKQSAESNWRAGVIGEKEIEQIPEFSHHVNIQEYSGADVKIEFNNHSWTSNGFVVSPNFFEVFNFELLIGNKEGIFDDPRSIILSKKLADQIFGNTDVMGKVLSIQTEYQHDYTIRGVYELPDNSSMDFNFIMPNNSADRFSKLGVAFIKMDSPKSQDLVTKLFEATKDHFANGTRYQSDLIPLTDLYFDGRNIQFFRVISRKGNIRNVYILSVICLIIGIVVILNCGGLKFSEEFDQRKNNALKRVCGATKKHQIIQFTINLLIESTIIIGLSIASFFILRSSLQQVFNFNFYQLDQLIVLIVLSTVVILLTAYLSTSTLLYRINLSSIGLKDSLVKNSVFNRSWITIVQFGFTIFLIIASIVVNRQYQSMVRKDLGFDSKNVLITNLIKELPRFKSREEGMNFYEAWKKNIQFLSNELENNPNITSFSRGSVLSPYPMDFKKEGSNDEFETGNVFIVTPGYDQTIGIRMKEGRFFDRELDVDRGESIVINETARERFNIQEIGNERLANASWGLKRVVGVVEDFHYEHLAAEVEPLVMYFFDDPERDYLIKIREGAEQEVIKFLEEVNSKINPGSTFTYSFLEDDIKELYDKEKQLSAIYLIFTIIICLISSSGLFAFAYHSLQHRIKEIGIRKVNGAKVTEVLALLNKDFIKWILISFIVATPLAWYSMNEWLKDFAFRIELEGWIFITAGLITLSIGLLTVSFLTWKAATRNPVEALRYE